MDKKTVFVDKNAKKELLEFSVEVQDEFAKRFDVLRAEGKLEYPEAKKISNDIFEIRIKLHGEYRGFYAYIQNNFIIILHFFRKKTQKTPVKNLETAQRRLNQYETR